MWIFHLSGFFFSKVMQPHTEKTAFIKEMCVYYKEIIIIIIP